MSSMQWNSAFTVCLLMVVGFIPRAHSAEQGAPKDTPANSLKWVFLFATAVIPRMIGSRLISNDTEADWFFTKFSVWPSDLSVRKSEKNE